MCLMRICALVLPLNILENEGDIQDKRQIFYKALCALYVAAPSDMVRKVPIGEEHMIFLHARFVTFYKLQTTFRNSVAVVIL